MTFLKFSGVSRTMKNLKDTKVKITDNITNNLNDTGLLMEREVKESIAGRKAEKRSVDTGQFLGSPKFKLLKKSVIIFSNLPQSVWMEFGTKTKKGKTKIVERRHFRNSLDRNKKTIKDIFQRKLL